jgi:hypothetical protein
MGLLALFVDVYSHLWIFSLYSFLNSRIKLGSDPNGSGLKVVWRPSGIAWFLVGVTSFWYDNLYLFGGASRVWHGRGRGLAWDDVGLQKA